MNERSLRFGRQLLRAVAIGIAIAGAIDPAVTSARQTRADIAVVAGDGVGDSVLARRVVGALNDRFTVVDGPFGGAAGTVVVGDRMPASAGDFATPVFAVSPSPDGPRVTIDAVNAPARAPLEARSAIRVLTRVTGARGRTLEVTLRRGGLVVDRASVVLASDDERQASELGFVPTAFGAVPLRVTAGIAGSASPTPVSADVALDIHDERRAVLFYDPRASWQSTFVRRAVERDPRFVVTSRVVTSRGVSTDAGHPPAGLADPSALEPFDAIIVGAADALGQGDVAGLDAYLRRRGGSVVLLLDQRTPGVWQRLAGVRDWDGTSSGAGFSVRQASADSVGLRASEIAWPRTLPPGARALAWSRPIGTDSGATHPVIWRSAVGAGQLIVSGALDAWRYRDAAQSRFDGEWREMIAAAADESMQPVMIAVDGAVAAGARTSIGVTLRDASLATVASNRPIRASVGAVLETPAGDAGPIRLWPEGMVGSFRGTFRAPAEPGSYRVVVTGDGYRAEAPVMVLASVARARAAETDLLAAWVGSRGGAVVSAARLDELVPTLQRVLRPVARRETWYPMRSAWWLLPFVVALAVEWLARRKIGLA